MIIRVNKTKDYTVMSNQHFREKEMSLKAKGLLSLMLSLPEMWDYSIPGLVAICKEQEGSITSTLKELKQFGYLKITKLFPHQTKSGRFEYIYDIYESPQAPEKQGVEKQPLEIQGLEKQPLEIQGLENQPLEIQGLENRGLNKDTNKSITKELNTKKVNKEDKINYQQIADMYNDTCVSFPRVKSLSEARKRMIKARLNTYSLDDVRTVFEKAEASDFLKGKNNRDWTATFDWMLHDGNFAKILDGNYDNKGVTDNGTDTELNAFGQPIKTKIGVWL